MKVEIKKRKLAKAVSLALMCGSLSSIGFSGTAMAFAEEEANDSDSEKILVTGSRIRRDEFASASPIQILSTDDAKKAGITTVAEMLQRISLANGAQNDETINTNSGNSNATEAPPSGGVGSQNVGLRGLGEERTLVLLNGRRLGASGVRGAPSQPDLSLIPFDMVDRVEVLSDSASAVYGADAVAGVVNIILKESVEGIHMNVNVSRPTEEGGDVTQFSFVTGTEGERSSFILGVESYERDRVRLGDRIDCVRRRVIDTDNGRLYDYCRNGFPDNTAILGNVWNWYTPGASDVTNPLTGNPVDNWSSLAGIPDPEGPLWSYPDFIVDTPVGFDRFTLNPRYSDGDDRLRADLVQPVKRFSIVGSGTYSPEWGQENATEIFYDFSYFHRDLENRASTEQIYPAVPALIPRENGMGGLEQNPDGSLVMYANPLNPFGQDAVPVITLDDLPQTRHVELDHFRASAGFRGDLPFEGAKENGWNYEVAVSYDRGDGTASQPLMNENHLAMTLETLRFDSDGNLVCGINTPVNDNNGGILYMTDCVPVNFFSPTLFPVNGQGAGAFATDEERAYLLGTRVNRTIVEQTIFSGYVSGDLFSFDNGGTASLVVGTELRRDKIDSAVDFLGENGINVGENPATEGPTRGERDVNEIFAEISLPILEGVEGADELTADLAVRFTDESNFGEETTERLRVTYAPVDWISISAAHGTAFRAPNLREQFLGDQFGGIGGGEDPCNAANYVEGNPAVYSPALDTRADVIINNCLTSGVDPTVLGMNGTTTIPVRTGGNVTDLKPETAEQTTLTLKATPVSNSDYEFDFAITYFDILIENTIQSLGADFIMDRCYQDAPDLSSPYCNRVAPRDLNRPDQFRFPTFVDASFVNIGSQTSVGYDINTRLGVNFDDVFGAPMQLAWTTQLTIQDELTRTILEEDGSDDLLGTYGNPEERFTTTLSMSSGDFILTYTGRYVGETNPFIQDPETDTSGCLMRNAFAEDAIVGNPQNLVFECVAESKYYSDIALTWAPEGDFAATFGVKNVADEQPAQVSSGQGNDRGGRMVGTGYDQIGRTVFLNMSYKF